MVNRMPLGTFIPSTSVSPLVLLAKQNDQIKEDEMGRACSMNRREEECI
jgi:hypothetical protein